MSTCPAAVEDRPACQRPDRLPWSALMALATLGFLAIMSEVLPAGLLLPLAEGFGVHRAQAGQLVTVYAVGSVVSAVPLVLATQGWRRRTVLLLATGGFVAGNALTAAAPSYRVALLARFVAGVAAGLAWGVIATHARRIVAAPLGGRAIALAGLGQPVALAFGIPLGNWLSTTVDWRVLFAVVAAMGVGLGIWIRLGVPDLPGTDIGGRPRLGAPFAKHGVLAVLVVAAAWVLAHNTLYTYIAPLVGSRGAADHTALALLVFGVASVAGLLLTAKVVSTRIGPLLLASVATFAIGVAVLVRAAAWPPLVVVGVAIWGLSFGGAPALLQAALAEAAEEAAEIAQSVFVTLFNIAVAGGGALGGLLLAGAGPDALLWTALALAGVAGLAVTRMPA